MKRETLRLAACRFTTTSACAREIIALLEFTDYKLGVVANDRQIEELANELESCVMLSRVVVERDSDEA